MNWRLAPPEVAYIVNDAQSKVLRRRAGVRAGARRDRERPHHRQEDRRDRRSATLGTSRSQAWRRPPRRRRPGTCRPGAGRRRLPALLVGHHRPAEGRAAHQPQPLLRAADVPARDGAAVRDAVNLVAMPLFHIGGGGWAMRRHDCRVCQTSCCERWIRSRSSRLIERHKVTHAFLVPAVLQFMLHAPGDRQRPTSRPRDDGVRRVADLDAGADRLVPRLRLRVPAGSTG